MLVLWIAAVVVAKDPAVPLRVDLILVCGLLYLHPVAAVVGLSEEHDEHAQEPPVPQGHRTLVRQQPAFNHHSLAGARARRHAHAGAVENADFEEEIDQFTEGAERIGTPGKVLRGCPVRSRT